MMGKEKEGKGGYEWMVIDEESDRREKGRKRIEKRGVKRMTRTGDREGE